MTILQVIGARERDLGGFVVRRVLPFEGRQMVGPFIFFDHLGPTLFPAGHGIDVRPHPHIGLATVTYLFSGSLEHRDTLGNIREILPGDVNWMTAGTGIAHSERTPQAARAAQSPAHGIQSWVALPDGQEDVEPSFVHYPGKTLPQRSVAGGQITVIAGKAYDLVSPVKTLWPTFYVDAQLEKDAKLTLPPDYIERAVYVAAGEVLIGTTRLREGQLGLLAPGDEARLEALTATRAMLLGGERFPSARYIWWNFVASSKERIEAAKTRWQARAFPPVPGESEFIPLPQQ
jgi:redox-sensitive bicupin YhaK (pirin superfamily)